MNEERKTMTPEQMLAWLEANNAVVSWQSDGLVLVSISDGLNIQGASSLEEAIRKISEPADAARVARQAKEQG